MVTQVIIEQIDIREAILANIGRGESSAIKKKVLARLCNTNERQLRLEIIELLKAGYPICSKIGANSGYFLAKEPEEIKSAMQTLHNYGVSAFEHRKYLQHCLNNMEAPLDLLDNGQIKMNFAKGCYD